MMTMMTNELTDIRRRVDRQLAERSAARAARVEASATLDRATANHAAALQAVAFTQTVAKSVQDRAHARIADVVSRSLEAVFGESAYEFRIVFTQKRGRTEATLVFTRDGEDIDPKSAVGGGVVDVAAFALRVSCLMLSRPPLRRLLILDEPFKWVSSEYIGPVRQLMLDLSKELNIQIIFVTHNPALECGNVIHL